MNLDVLALWNQSRNLPLGKQIFSRGLCLRAPYFGSISPTFETLEPGRSEATFANSRKVRNHLGTVHAIACCNAAELVAGTLAEVTVPSTHRWIPMGMTVRYLHKATTDLRAIAVAELPPLPSGEGTEWIIPVSVRDTADVEVVHADITMWVSPKTKR
ncbi:hotdog fold domain-containing protein [Nocardia sp. NPDC060249]|uniref:hotdog fold domain-containing protein n=1 Tax=Nocardia sp. NPDC060249 TaxID=3347082 RepID=UPI0036581DA2